MRCWATRWMQEKYQTAAEGGRIMYNHAFPVLTTLLQYLCAVVLHAEGVFPGWTRNSLKQCALGGMCTCIVTCRLLTKFPAVISFRDSCQDGIMQFFSVSTLTVLIFFWKSSSTQSMIRMMRWGGRPRVRTVAMSDGLIVWGKTE